MLKSFVCTVELWGGDKIVTEKVTADNPKRAEQKARDAAHKNWRVPYAMIKVDKVEIDRA